MIDTSCVDGLAVTVKRITQQVRLGIPADQRQTFDPRRSGTIERGETAAHASTGSALPFATPARLPVVNLAGRRPIRPATHQHAVERRRPL